MSSKNIILFDKNSTSSVSAVFSIWPRYAMMLSAYGLAQKKVTKQVRKRQPDGTYALVPKETYEPQIAVVQKVLTNMGAVPTGDMCEGSLIVEASKIVQVEDITQCGPWQLNPCQNTVILALPGYYRLEIDPSALGDVEIRAIEIPFEAASLNQGLILGNTNCHCA